MTRQPVARCASVAALALACASVSMMATAQPEKMMTGARDFSSGQQASVQLQAQITAGRAALAKQLGSANTAAPGGTQPAETFANPQRAYPPSCLSSPIPLQFGLTSDPNALTAQITLPGHPESGDPNERAYSETDTFYVWRVSCSGGKSATLLEIDRPAAMEGNTTLFPVLPGVTIPLNGGGVFVPRIADDPNTFFATNYSIAPLVNSDIYILENIYGQLPTVDYNQAFTLDIDNFDGSGNLIPFNLPSYVAPTNPPLLPISGYMSTNWSSSTQGGEGIVMQIYNVNQTTRVLAFAWFTYDAQGFPFWLYGQANVAIGATSVTAPTVYFKGGTFAPPTTSPGAPLTNWGSVTFTFPDCAHMKIVYTGDASAVGGPTGNGSATYVRVADVNGLVCQ
jgi:hypothetical protein